MVSEMMLQCRHRKMNECSVALSDFVVLDVKKRILDKITEYYQAPNSLLAKFNVLESFFSGEKAEKVLKSIRDCVGNGNNNGSADTGENLQQLATICQEIENMIETVKTIVPDVSHFAMFEVRCFELKDLLNRQLRFLLSLILDAVNEENRNHMMNISSRFQEIANTMISDITDSSELRQLQEFVAKSASTLSDLNEQYVGVCVERVKFLLTFKHKLARDDISVLYNTYNWPTNIQSYIRRAYESLSVRKKELEELLEEDQRRLENELNDLYKRVEVIADNGSPMEFRKNVERINIIKRDLEAKQVKAHYEVIMYHIRAFIVQEKAEEITERETLLEVPHNDYMSKLEEIRVNLDPLERLWLTVKSFVEKTHYWHETKV